MKQKRQLVILVVLLVAAAGVWFWYFREDKPVTADVGTPNYVPLPVDDPKLRVGEIDKSRKTEYKNVGGRNIFSRELPVPVKPKEPPKLPPSDPRSPEYVPPPPSPPQARPLPAKFFGYGTVPNGTAKLGFLINTEGDVFVVREGDLFQNSFRILKIGNVNLDYEDTAIGLRGTAPLEEQASPAGGPPA